MDTGDFICPVCGGDVFANAKACPHCGADDRSGWRDDADLIAAGSSLGPDGPEDFDYDAFLKNEFGDGETKRSGKEWMWWVVAVLLLIAFVLAYALG